MRRLLILGVVLLVAAGCGSSKSSNASSTVKVAGSKLGQIVVDRSGRTLYLFEADKTAKSTCSGACAATWPPYRVGAKQVVYHGHPLYYYAGDGKSPGSTKGEGLNTFGARWYAVDETGKGVKSAGSGSEMSGGNGGYGY